VKKICAGRAIVLLSGGLDSTTTLYVAKSKGYKVFCLIFDYGQRHRREINAARKIAKKAGCPAKVIKICLPWKGSSLLDKNLKIPKSGLALSGRHKITIPSTYVPARNTIFLSFALSYAEAIGASHIFIGANALDYSGYPDCRPSYFHAFKRLAQLATKRGVERQKLAIEVPLLHLKKSQIIEWAKRLGVPYRLTWSCYCGGQQPCGRCESCLLRARGFREAGMADPLMKS